MNARASWGFPATASVTLRPRRPDRLHTAHCALPTLGNPVRAQQVRLLGAQGRRLRRRGALRLAPYLSAVWIVVKVVLSFVPSPVITGMIATAMPVTIRPYSIAVAARSSFKKAM